MLTVSGAGRHYGFVGKWIICIILSAFNQCFAKANISGDVCFLFRKLYQVSVNAKVRAVRSESKTVLVDAHARGKNLLCGNDDQQLSREVAVAARFIASIKFCPNPRLKYSAF